MLKFFVLVILVYSLGLLEVFEYAYPTIPLKLSVAVIVIFFASAVKFVICGLFLSMFPIVTDATLVLSVPWFVLSILLAYTVLLLSIVNGPVYVFHCVWL